MTNFEALHPTWNFKQSMNSRFMVEWFNLEANLEANLDTNRWILEWKFELFGWIICRGSQQVQIRLCYKPFKQLRGSHPHGVRPNPLERRGHPRMNIKQQKTFNWTECLTCKIFYFIIVPYRKNENSNLVFLIWHVFHTDNNDMQFFIKIQRLAFT